MFSKRHRNHEQAQNEQDAQRGKPHNAYGSGPSKDVEHPSERHTSGPHPRTLPFGASQNPWAKNSRAAASADSLSKLTSSKGVPPFAGNFCVIVPDQSPSPTNDMWEYSIDRRQDGTQPRRVISYLSEEWLTYRAWVQNLSSDLSKDGSCAAVACSGGIISIGRHNFGRASNTKWGNHAEENLLVTSPHASRRDHDYVHDNGKHEKVVAVDLQISCILICLEPCFDNGYSGHGCRDFFTPKGRFFKSHGTQDQKRIWGRFVPAPNQHRVPIFCFELQASRQAAVDDLPDPMSVSAFFSRKEYLTSQRRRKRWINPDYYDSIWSREVRGLYGPYYGGYPLSDGEWHTMYDFMTKNNWTTMNDMVVPKEADHMPRSHVLGTTTNMGYGGSASYEELSARYEKSREGSHYALGQRAGLQKNLSEAQDKAEQLQRELEKEMQWTLASPSQETYNRRRLPDVAMLLERKMRDPASTIARYRSLGDWEKERPEEVHHATVHALWELSQNAKWIVQRRTEVVAQNERTIDYWLGLEKQGWSKQQDG